MKKLLEAVEKETAEELKRANEKFNPIFNSTHEGYAVTLEEVEEVEHEVILINTFMADLWENVKNNDNSMIPVLLEDIKEHSQRAACEAIQVAAMAEKFLQSFYENDKKTGK